MGLARPADPSYRALLAVPSVAAVLVGTQVARLSQQMASLALVLFVLATYGSAELAGLVAFLGLCPGLVLSPVAGRCWIDTDAHGWSCSICWCCCWR